jgi:basic amino acid/polyamine antiporter, APA family
LRTGARHRLAQLYGPSDLVVLGLGVTIGAGIFSIAGVEAATEAGPGVLISFMIAGIASLLAALCYAELSSTLPNSGSAYTFSYVIFGEVWAWIIGWALILEMLLAAAVLAKAWGLFAARALANLVAEVAGAADWLALGILVLLTGVVAVGTRIGLRVLWLMVGAKLLIIAAVITVGAFHVDVANFGDFLVAPRPSPTPPDTVLETVLGHTQQFGWFGVFAAASAIAFAYIGFDVVATAAEETVDAPKAMPKGMIRGLVIVTVLYLGVAIVMIGMVPYQKIDVAAPLSGAFDEVGVHWMVHVIDLGAVIGLTSVLTVLVVGLTRVLFSISRDGLLPPGLARISRRFDAPTLTTVVIGGCAALLSRFAPVLTLQELVVLGALFSYLFVAAGVVVMRRRMPDLERGFRVPLSPVLPALSVLATLWLMMSLQVWTWAWFGGWMAVGLLAYLGYGRTHSLLAVRPVKQGRGRHRR